MTGLERLRSPLRLGPVAVPNRLVLAAHLTNQAVDGRLTEQHVAYYEARARGGAGLVITEELTTDPADRPYEKLVRGHDPAVVPAGRRIVEAVHRHGALAFAQINHNGPQSSGLYSRRPVLGPSAVVDPHFREVPVAATAADLAAVVAGYATVARHCSAAGFDGVELQCSHSSILRCFLAPGTNRRNDGYGRDLAGRARLLLEVVAAVRTAIGPGRALGVRLSGGEAVPGGTILDDAVAVAALLAEQGAVDYLSTGLGVATASLYLIEASMRTAPGYALHVPAALRRVVDLPLLGIGRFDDLATAERALEEGHCDLVGIVRGQIADPELGQGPLRRVARRPGHRGEPAPGAPSGAPRRRRCLACNQECVGRVGVNRWLGCAVNPEAGREAAVAGAVAGPEAGPGAAAAGGVAAPRRPQRVVVAGAGPAGMEAAVTAARRGHRVVVLERSGAPGGQLRTAAQGPGRGGLAALIADQVDEAAALGVDLRLGTEATPTVVLAERPDAVVVATGARPGLPRWVPPGAGCVADTADVLDGRARPTGRVVVVDELGSHHATSVAELLAGGGATVTLATPHLAAAEDLGTTLDLEHWRHLAHDLGITERTGVVPLSLTVDAGAGGTCLSLLHHPTATTTTLVCDWVVLAVPAVPVERLYLDLKASGEVPVQRVGDCVAPRRVDAAVREGRRAGEAL